MNVMITLKIEMGTMNDIVLEIDLNPIKFDIKIPIIK